jgi:sugar/nucleoside kinase (ribokinase family)
VNRQPKCGETMAANNFECLPRGKGANACIASARLGSNNAFICKVSLIFNTYITFTTILIV